MTKNIQAQIFVAWKWNGIKMRFSNKVFYVYLRKLSQNWGEWISSTSQLLSNIGEKISSTIYLIYQKSQYKKKKLDFL